MSIPRLISAHRRPPPNARGGFALLITITLVAFLVLVLVGFATLTRVETRLARNNLQLANARQNALFGLNIALGRLQQTAGPDQRITATADLIAGRDPSKQNWTGVWNADPTNGIHGEHLAWLTSGTTAGEASVNTALAAAEGNRLVELVHAHSVDISAIGAGVRAETEPIKSNQVPGLPDDPSGHVVGAFAYWVGDEGVKAKASLVDPWHDSTSAEERLHSFVAAQRFGIELVDASGETTLEGAWPVNDARLNRVISLEQLSFMSANPDTLSVARRNRFHDLTTRSVSVLADVAQGGLKKDLTNWLSAGAPPSGAAEQDSAPIISTAEGSDHGLPRWGLLRSFAALTDTEAPMAPRPQTDLQHGLHPVITYFRLGLAISCAGDGQPLRIHLFPTIVLWNPHAISLAHVDPETGDPVRYEVAFAIRGASSRLRFTVNGTPATEKALLSLNKANIGDAGPANQYFRFEVAPSAPIPPGQSLVFTLADDADYAPGANTLIDAADSGASVTLYGATLNAADIAAGINRGTLTGNSMDVVLRTKPAATDPAPADYEILPGAYQTIQRVGFGNVTSSQLIKPVPSVPPIAPRFQLQLFANMSSAGIARVRWIAQQNYRASFIPRPAIDGSSYHAAYTGAAVTDPAPPNFAESGARASAGVSVQDPSATDLVLAELRPQHSPLFSLAQLQHANLSQVVHYPTYAIGNSLAPPYLAIDATSVSPGNNAGDYTRFHDLSYLLNRTLWDRYFFSTVPATLSATDLAAPEHHLPNARHVIRRQPAPPAVASLRGSAAFDTAAAHLMLNGGFNINSTSTQAWRALLASHLGQAVDPASTDNRHPFSRHTRAPAGNPNRAWEGYRILSDRQVARLADHIVDEVKSRGPFLSLADFINRRLQIRGANPNANQRFKGALQAAIDTTDTETGPDAAPINTHATFADHLVPNSTATSDYHQAQFQGGETRQAPYSSRSAFAPGYLTQADLLTALGPVLVARSDTFLVRTYGEVRNPVTGDLEGRAWCEAIVQRQPDYLDASLDAWENPSAGSAAARFGRRFQVIDFRWLNESDI